MAISKFCQFSYPSASIKSLALQYSFPNTLTCLMLSKLGVFIMAHMFLLYIINGNSNTTITIAILYPILADCDLAVIVCSYALHSFAIDGGVVHFLQLWHGLVL